MENLPSSPPSNQFLKLSQVSLPLAGQSAKERRADLNRLGLPYHSDDDEEGEEVLMRMSRQTLQEEEEEKCFDHRVPTMVERREEVNSLLGTHLPFSSMMRRMAAKYQRPSNLQTPSNLNLPLLSSPLHLSSHPYSKLIATLASSYSITPGCLGQMLPGQSINHWVLDKIIGILLWQM